jgi:hypothetical protein
MNGSRHYEREFSEKSEFCKSADAASMYIF